MILEIRLSNFFSIDEEVVLDLQAAPLKTQKSKQLEGNVFEWNGQKLLKSVALYGANASGKSNIIKAIRFCCRMVLDSHLYNEDKVFDFQPFKFAKEKSLSSFFIRFVNEGIEYEYSFSLTRNQIIEESLYYYPKGRRAKVFERDERKSAVKQDKYSFSSAIKRPMDVVENTSVKSLFLSRASQMDRDIPKKLYSYFYANFILGYTAVNASVVVSRFNQYKDLLLKALQVADSDIVDISLKREVVRERSFDIHLSQVDSKIQPQERDVERLKIVSYHRSQPNIPFDFETEESDGTKKLFFILLSILDVVRNNKILMIDEIETSLHTSMVSFIVDLFHQGESCQLIYSTHNTNLLDLDSLRKDQIYFVNKTEKASTDLYSLYDYKDFRENMDLEKAYLQGRFDAIPVLGESPLTLSSLFNG